MLLIGLLLLGASGAFTCLVIAYNLSGGPEYTVSLFGQDIATLNTLTVFCSGLALALVFCLGLAVALNRAAHGRHRKPRSLGPREATTLHDSGAGGDHGR